MKQETLTKFLSLTDNGRTFNVEDTGKGLAITWDFSEEEEGELVQLEYPGTAPEMVQERFEDIVRGIIHASIQHAKNANSNASGAE
jgi:hypothetical protein